MARPAAILNSEGPLIIESEGCPAVENIPGHVLRSLLARINLIPETASHEHTESGTIPAVVEGP